MSGKLGQLFTRNWPIKLVAIALSVMLYVAVAAQQPTTRLFQMKVVVDVPPGRTLTSKAPTVAVQISGRGTEVAKLLAFPPVIKRAVPDTLAGSVWTVRLEPSDVQLPRGADVRVDEIVPREIELLLDAVARKEVRIVPRVEVRTDSGFVFEGGLSLTPAIARVVGPEEDLAAIDSVTTVPVEISEVTGSFSRRVPIDTAVLGRVRVIPKEVEIAGNVGALAERSFAGIAVETGAGALTSFTVVPARVSVAVRGPEAVVSRLTRDSLRVVASIRGRVAAGAYAHLTVVAPRGVTARAVPDSVALQRRSRRG